MSKVGEKLKEFREKNNVSKSDLARILHVSPAYITTLENGKRDNPSNNLLINISSTLQIPITELVEDTTDEKKQELLKYMLDDFITRTQKEAFKNVYETIPQWTNVGFENKFNTPFEFWSDVIMHYPHKFCSLSDLFNNKDFDNSIDEIAKFLEVAFDTKVKEIVSRTEKK
ncbi:helix-turn-helix domain-containing protein [Clostridium neonatale]|uniref:helix-turn-helix domain-containing protein n=1 Tax=Clostridium neonatale TaxID=137838 RepID=UPI00291B9F05|nr:putative HTH-type transcriptional regulator SinR [Clostridium neonatale]